MLIYLSVLRLKMKHFPDLLSLLLIMGTNLVNGFKPIYLIAIILILSAVCCRQAVTNFSGDEIDSIGRAYVPEPREGIFTASLEWSGNTLVLRGETDVREAKEAISSLLESRGIIFADSLAVLPGPTLAGKPWGLVNVSVCNLRAESSYSSELVSQALMGTPVRVLKKDGGWFLIQTPDRYLGWVDSDAIVTMTVEEHTAWKSSRRIFYSGKNGEVFTDPSHPGVISDIAAGCIAEATGEKKNHYEVRLPDGRIGFIPKDECILLGELTTDNLLKTENLKSTALSYTGIPYLWGGTSVKGFDCSGFVKTVYFLGGIILARDASLQFRNGIRISKSAYPDSLSTGDLLFFGSVRDGKPRATHVGMYIGNSEFIHASGMVKVNSLDSTRGNFSRYRRDTFLGVRRVIGAEQDNGIRSLREHDWYY
jgi:gamma-D-glutamyl-L-lysine dipeptidyl-peptidase